MAAPLSTAEIRRLQEIEGNPFTSEDEAMFEMFEREGWNAEQRSAYIRRKYVPAHEPFAAE